MLRSMPDDTEYKEADKDDPIPHKDALIIQRLIPSPKQKATVSALVAFISQH